MRRVLYWLAYLVGFGVLWFVLVGHVSVAEWIASVVAATLCAALSKASSPETGRVSGRWVAEFARLPLQIIADSVSICRILARRLRGELPSGADVDVELVSADEPAPSPVELSLEVIRTTLKPTTWVVDVAEDGRSMRVHRLSLQSEAESKANGAGA